MKHLSFLFCGVLLLLTCIGSGCTKEKDSEPPKVLRVLVTEADEESIASGLHRIEMPIDRERALLQSFARENHWELQFVPVPSFPRLFEYLNDGKGDLISANVAETAARKEKYLLSRPFAYTREMVFSASSNKMKINAPGELAGKTGWLLPGTTYEKNFRTFAAALNYIRFKVLPATISHDDLIEAVENRKLFYSVLNECDLDVWLSCNAGIRKLFPIRERVPLVFAARKDSVELMQKLNAFLEQLPVEEPTLSSSPIPVAGVPAAAAKKTPPVIKPVPTEKQAPSPAPKKELRPEKKSLSDLALIRKRGYIRMLTSNTVFCCYLEKGQTRGFEYELAKRFADSLHVELVTVIVDDFQDLVKCLREGKGDFIAANITRSPERIRDNPLLTFCAPYHGVTEVLIGREKEKLRSLADLKGRRIFVRRGTSYCRTLQEMQKKGAKFSIVFLPEYEEEAETIFKVGSAEYDLTVADDVFLQYAQNRGCRVRNLMTLGEKRPYSWIVRRNNPQLASAINAFMKKEDRSTFFNLCLRRYYHAKQVKSATPWNPQKKDGNLSPYDVLFKKYGMIYQFDWYFLAAQAYQETRFRPDTVNEIGAAGMMQIMPKTAKELGIRDLKKPENGIHAGTRYLAKLLARFRNQTPELSRLDQLCFSLAAYNAGYGHVQDARRLAAAKGWNPNVWFAHTEKALALLEKHRYAAQSKYGYCRASETIPYVRNIMRYTEQYRKFLMSDEYKALQAKKRGK